MPNLSKEQGEAFCNTLNAFNAAWADRQKQTSVPLQQAANSEDTTKSYRELHTALNQNDIKDHLGDEVKGLRETLSDSLKSSDYSIVDAFFDKLLKQKKCVEVVKVVEVEKGNPKLSLAGKLNEFGKAIQNALNNITGINRAS